MLVVEDDAAVRRSVERALSFEGYQVVTAADGMAGLLAVADRAPDLMVLDVMMPVLDGLAVCRRLRDATNSTIVSPASMPAPTTTS